MVNRRADQEGERASGETREDGAAPEDSAALSLCLFPTFSSSL